MIPIKKPSGQTWAKLGYEFRERAEKAEAEVERLRGLVPDLPPRPPDGVGLLRYGIRHNGPTQPLAVPMADGYWTPWHLVEAALRTVAERQREACAKEIEMGQSEKLHRVTAANSVRATPLVTEVEP